MTWRLQAELPLRLEYTPRAQFELTGQIIVVRDINALCLTLKQKDQSTSQGSGRAGWAKSSSCQESVTSPGGRETKRNTFPMCARWPPRSRLPAVHSSRVWKLRRSSSPSRLGSTQLALSQQRLTLTFYWGGGGSRELPLTRPKERA